MNMLDLDTSPPSVITAEANLIASGKETAATVSQRHSPGVWQLIIDKAHRMKAARSSYASRNTGQ